jgi:hypothetical protein
VSAWLLPFALTTYLALSGGGYDTIARSELGIVLWWIVLLGLLAGALPGARLPRSTWIAVAAFSLFLLWTWLAAGWSQSEERTLTEVARLSTYLGTLTVGVLLLTRASARSMVNGITAGIVLVCGLAVLSRLTPSLFPADTASQFYATSRLRYPFDYSDGVGEFAALGLPLLLYVATSARTAVGRAAAAAGLPVVVFCLALTVSRGGILAGAVGVIAFLALAEDRLPRLVPVASTAVASTALMLALLDRPGLRNRLSGVAPSSQRSSMLAILVVVMLVSAAAQAGFTLMARRRARPSWLRFSRRGAQTVGGALLAGVAIAVVVLIATGTDHRLWTQFKEPSAPASGNTYFRLLSVAGSHRYQYWQAAIHAFDMAPVKGIGPGTFEFWWAEHNTLKEFVRNAHSLWIETLAETGLAGLALLATFFGYVLWEGSRRALRAGAEARILHTAAVAGVAAFCASAAFDWVWQIGVMPMIAMLLAAVAISPLSEPDGAPRSWRIRLVCAAAVLVALATIWVPLASTIAVRRSQSAVSRRELQAALDDSTTAQQLEPGAASPRLQRALVLEQAGDVPGSNHAIRAALEREPTNWQIWLVASRLATEADQPVVALADYRRARALNPTSPIFAR